MKKQPNFFLAGVPKAGTTSLYHYLAQHPDIFVSPIKEPGFYAAADFARHRFARQILGPARREAADLRAYLNATVRPQRQHGLVLQHEDYLDLFRDARHESAIGEATVAYFSMPGAAAAIRAAIPHARILLVLRDPSERLFSQYLASDDFKRGRPFRDCLDAALNENNIESTWLDSSRYATHVTRFLANFPRQQMRIFLYDEYRADPAGTVRDAFAFLGVDPDRDVDTSRRYNTPLSPRWHRVHPLVHRLTRSRAARLVPEDLRAATARLYYRPAADRITPQDRVRIIQLLGDEVTGVGALIGRDLSHWLQP